MFDNCVDCASYVSDLQRIDHSVVHYVEEDGILAIENEYYNEDGNSC